MQLKKTKEIKRGNGGKAHKHRAKELTSQEALFKKKMEGEFKHITLHGLKETAV